MHDASDGVMPGVKTILVLRPNAVGDFVFALPALHALKAAYPEAKIVYIGKRWHADFLKGRPGSIDEVVVMPPYPGIGIDAGKSVDPAPIQSFIDSMRRVEPDLALQIYGGGRYSNPFIKRLGARLTIGLKAADAEPLDRWLAFGPLQNKRLQMLEAAALAGASSLRLGRELEVTDEDRREAGRTLALPDKPVVLIQPGASDARRRWPSRYFSRTADTLAAAGAVIAVNGTASEAGLVAEVIEHMRYPALDLSGKLSLAGLCGLLQRCALVVSNDTGPLHLALAIGTPSIGIYWLTNLYESGPLRQDIHRAAVSAQTRCPVCGEENLRSRCAHDVSFVQEARVEEVVDMALDLLRHSH